MRRGIQPIAEQSGAKQRTGIVKLLRDSHLETDVNYMALYDAAPSRWFEYDTARSISNGPKANFRLIQMPTTNVALPTPSIPKREHPGGFGPLGVLRWLFGSFRNLAVGSWQLGIVCALLISISAAADSGRDSITEASVRAHLEFLASDALNGRGSGTR